MTVLEQLRALYFSVTRSSIGDDFATAIDLFKQLTTDEDREKAAVFMEGIAEMRREWGADAVGGAGTRTQRPKAGAGRRHSGTTKATRPKPR